MVMGSDLLPQIVEAFASAVLEYAISAAQPVERIQQWLRRKEGPVQIAQKNALQNAIKDLKNEKNYRKWTQSFIPFFFTDKKDLSAYELSKFLNNQAPDESKLASLWVRFLLDTGKMAPSRKLANQIVHDFLGFYKLRMEDEPTLVSIFSYRGIALIPEHLINIEDL